QAPENALDSILINVSSPDLFARTAFVMSCLAGGILVSRLLRRQLESAAALEASEARYRRLHQTMRDAFVQMDMTGRIVDANDAFQQMLGHEKKALLSMKEADLTPPRWRASIAKIVSEQVLPLGRSEVFEKEYLRADGSRFPAELRTFLITDDSGNPIGMWSIVRDVTQRKQAEMEREAAIKALKRSNEDLKQFAYVASHDLQEPLRMVASYTQLLAERYEDQLDQKAHKFIHYAVDGAQRMQILIRDLLAFSRVETRAQAFKPLDSHHVLCGAMANLKTLINETGALVTSGDLPIVQADESQLTQLFQNLISNGIKFRQPSTTPSIHISAQRVENRWRLAVQDNGIGIDSKYKERVFVIFQRLHTRDEYPGTGIGLAICKRIVHRHGGRIWFESSPGKGTTFYFTLPSI
ncbi:MAG: ATP-binding protein, partial [Desulfobacteraceae bacterium]